MYRLPLFLLVGCVLLPHVRAHAQQLYKVVGADGKITFSDKPQISEKTKLSVMRANSIQLVEPPARAPAPGTVRPVKRSGAAAPMPSVSSEVEEVMLVVMGFASLERKYEHFCVANETILKSFVAANAGWRQRNAPYIEQQKRLLMEVLSPRRRSELLGREAAVQTTQFATLKASTPGARVEWCAEMVALLNGGTADANLPEMLTIPITPYRAD